MLQESRGTPRKARMETGSPSRSSVHFGRRCPFYVRRDVTGLGSGQDKKSEEETNGNRNDSSGT